MGPLLIFLLLLLSCEAKRDYREVSEIPWESSWERATARASREGKPIFLYFYALWCSWCREYEKVLEDEEVRRELVENFVPLLLDSDRDRKLFTRFGGRGTPFTVILDPRERVIVRFHGAVRKEDLLEVLNVTLRNGFRYPEEEEGFPIGEMSEETYRRLLNSFLEDLRVRFDPRFGGFSSPSEGGAIFKWPTPVTYSFLLRRGYMLEEVLFSINMDIEFLFDEVDGGFFNFYDRTRAFDFHFETSKSLRVNGEMIGALVEAFRRTGRRIYLDYALRTFSYMEEFLLHTGSGCYLNAQISDPRYYNLSPEKRRKEMPPPTDTAIIVEDNGRAALGLLALHSVTGDDSVLRRVRSCLGYITGELIRGDRLYRFYDVKRGVKGSPGYGRDVSFLSLALLRAGMREKALEISRLKADHDWVSLSVLARVLTEVGDYEGSKKLLKGVRVRRSFQNPDDMVLLLEALELFIERQGN